MAKVDPFGLFPSAVRQTLNKSSSFCLKIPCSHYWSLQHRNSVIPASLPLQPLVLQVINTPGGSTGSAAALAGLGNPGSNHWNLGQAGKTSGLVLGNEEGTGACESHPGVSKSSVITRSLWGRVQRCGRTGFGDHDAAWPSPTSAEPLCPHGSPQTWHCRRERIQGPTGEPESYVGVAGPRVLHSRPAPVGSLCLGGSKVRGMSLILSPSGHCHLLVHLCEGRSCGC